LRISVFLKPEEATNTFPDEYRKGFIFLFKTIVKEQNRYQELYGIKKHKPFCFAARLGYECALNNRTFTFTGPVILKVSSGDHAFFAQLLNGFIGRWKRSDEIKLYQSKFRVSDIRVLPPKRITKSEIVCDSLERIVLKDPNKRGARYLSPYDDLEYFNRILSEYSKDKYYYFMGKEAHGNLYLEPLNGKFDSVRHYGGLVFGYRGSFRLYGSPELLQFVYDYGLGHRTGQGFGYIVIRGEGI